jgi:hypothetical protein
MKSIIGISAVCSGAALLLLLTVLAAHGFAAAAAPRIVAIQIEGAGRTDREAVLRLARVREGDPWHDGLDGEARQLLMNAGIFYDVAVTHEQQGDGVLLRIALKDKWTLIPIPMISVKDGVTSWGGSVMESNLLGTGSLLFVFLSVTGGEPGGTLMYVDPHLGGTRWQLFAAAGLTDERRDVWDATGKTGSYRRQTTGGFLSVGYRFAARTSLAVGLRLSDFSFSDPREAAQAPADARERSLALSLRHEGANADEERREGLSGMVNLEAGASALGDQVGRTAASGTVRWARSIFGRQILSLTGHALWTDTVAYEAALPAAGFLRGYEADRFRPDRLLGGTLECQLSVARYKDATVSVVPFADAALLRDRYRSFSLADAQADAGLALAVYLRRVALPVLQIYGAYGFASDAALYGLSLGFGF